MATIPLGIFFGGVIVGIPVVTGVAEGVSHQKKQNEEAANETRMSKFYIDVFCETLNSTSNTASQLNDTIVVVRGGRLWLCPKDPESELGLPKPQIKGQEAPHPFTGFYIQYPDEDRFPPQRGLVSTISVDPPMLNWIYIDKDTLALKYGNRTASIAHIVGPWDWTEDETGVMLEGWEGFVAVEVPKEERCDGLKWALYYDADDNMLNKRKMVGGAKVMQVSLERRLLPEELVKKQDEEADRKLQVKTTGDMRTKWG